MSLLHKEPVKRVEQVLKAFDPTLTVIVLKTSARTAIEASSSLGCEVGAIVKSLLFKTENSFTLCLVAGDRKASIIKIKKTLNIKDVSMASADEVKDVTGFTIGGVSPVGHLNKIDVFISDIHIVSKGIAIPYYKDAVVSAMADKEVHFKVNLNLGEYSANAWGCDLTEDYVVFNSAYST